MASCACMHMHIPIRSYQIYMITIMMINTNRAATIDPTIIPMILARLSVSLRGDRVVVTSVSTLSEGNPLSIYPSMLSYIYIATHPQFHFGFC